MSQTSTCATCGAEKPPFVCGICEKPVCKDCLEYLDTSTFSFLSKMPPKLKLANYCRICFDDVIVPEKAKYDELMERAEDTYFLTKAYPGYVRVLRRHTKRVVVPSCEDRRETILRLAFFAAELGYNAIIESEVESKKVRTKNGRQTSIWSGSAMPAQIDGEQLERSALRRL